MVRREFFNKKYIMILVSFITNYTITFIAIFYINIYDNLENI